MFRGGSVMAVFLAIDIIHQAEQWSRVGINDRSALLGE
jgi:hypothetical protein